VDLEFARTWQGLTDVCVTVGTSIMKQPKHASATIYVQLETRANTDASWVDIGVDVPPDLLRIFITISVLI